MNKTLKILLIAISTIVGILLTIYLTFFFIERGSIQTRTKTYEFDHLTSINIDLVESDIEVKNGDVNKLEVLESNKTFHDVRITDGHLDISRKSIYSPFEILFPHFFSEMKITLYLTDELYESLDIRSVTGKISVNDVSTKIINIETVSGSVSSSNLKANEAFYKSVSSSFSLNDLDVTSNLNIETVTGDISLINSDSNYIFTKTVSANIYLNLRTNKTYDIHSISGKVSIPSSEEKNGHCKVDTVSGNVTITLA